LVYPMFNQNLHIGVPEQLTGEYFISVDYGTMNPTSMGLWCRTFDGHAYRMAESYYDGRKSGRPRTDEEHYAALCALADGYEVQSVIVDPSAASFIECVHRHGRFRVQKANNAVIPGIQDTAVLLDAGRLHFSEDCTDCIREFGLYRYDPKKQDTVIKENDHAMDDMRYFVRGEMWRVLQELRR
ncbi:MAG: PBSX family phage terminase large subunit, partial [Oscillospiraceae bacterium]|nr:PBSX family phage terminase large subunit [Oscillospiraceae bacterium]